MLTQALANEGNKYVTWHIYWPTGFLGVVQTPDIFFFWHPVNSD